MNILTILQERKILIIEVLVVIAVLYGCYYGYTALFASNTTASVGLNEKSLGSNTLTFISKTRTANYAFKDKTFLSTPYVQKLRDYTEIILPNQTRGREDPFIPYAASRPLR